jgi:hypothetical protein
LPNSLSEPDRRVLQKLSQAGGPTELTPDDLMIARLLESSGLALIIRNSSQAVITPKGRSALINGQSSPPSTKKPPFGFLG